MSGAITLGDGEPTNEDTDNDPDTSDSNENLTIDFGFTRPVFDLALFKQVADGTNLATVMIGQSLTFTMEIINQGDVDAADVTIVDYVPTGLTLDDPDWIELDTGDATITIAGPIRAGESYSVDITFTIDAEATGTIDNVGEISGAVPVDVLANVVTMPNGQPIPDIDSIADGTNNDTFILDDDVDGDANRGGDEDDHDRAQVTVSAPTPAAPTPAPDRPTLAFTGRSSVLLGALALAITMLGVVVQATARASRRPLAP